MKRGRKWWLLRVAAPLVAGLALFLWAMQERSQNLVTVENRSGQTIALLQVDRAGETSTFKDVMTGAEVRAASKTRSAFTVAGKLADGTLIKGRFGEMGPRAELVVLPGGQITIRKSKE